MSKMIKEYLLSHPDEIETCELFMAFLNRSDQLTESQRSGHFTGSTWIINYDRDKVLLTHHRKLNLWLQLGGHQEEGESPVQTALREGKEESGLSSLKLLENRIFDLDAHLIPARAQFPEHYHYDIRFLVEADSREDLTISLESKDLQWIEIDRLDDYNRNESVSRMARKTDLALCINKKSFL